MVEIVSQETFWQLDRESLCVVQTQVPDINNVLNIDQSRNE